MFSPTGTLDVRATVSGYDSANISALSRLVGVLTLKKTFMGGLAGRLSRRAEAATGDCKGAFAAGDKAAAIASAGGIDEAWEHKQKWGWR